MFIEMTSAFHKIKRFLNQFRKDFFVQIDLSASKTSHICDSRIQFNHIDKNVYNKKNPDIIG